MNSFLNHEDERGLTLRRKGFVGSSTPPFIRCASKLRSYEVDWLAVGGRVLCGRKMKEK